MFIELENGWTEEKDRKFIFVLRFFLMLLTGLWRMDMSRDFRLSD